MTDQSEWMVDTTAYLDEHVRHTPLFDDKLALLAWASGQSPPGAILEFGVFSGKSIQHLAGLARGRRVVGFDSFLGLPEPWHDREGVAPVGTFDLRGQRPSIIGVEIVEGWFADTLQPWLDANPEPIGLVHIDCDLYSSTKHVLDLLASRLSGVVVVFDEYCGYPDWRNGEWKALRDSGLAYDYIAHDDSGYQVAVRIR